MTGIRDQLKPFLAEPAKKAGEVHFCGVRLSDLSREELEAVAVWAHEAHMRELRNRANRDGFL